MRTPTRIAAIAGLALLGALAWLFLYEPRYAGLIEPAARPLAFAHRGFGNDAPDNSLGGARLALEAGLDGVDVDGQLTRDSEIVIFHDVSLERFTTGEGRVDARTLEELRGFDLAVKFGRDFPPEPIAAFEDFVREITPRAILMVELKVPGFADTGIERRALEIIEKHDAFARVYLSSFNPVVLLRLKRLDARVRTVFIFKDTGWDPERVAQTKVEDRVALPWYLLNELPRRAIRKLIRPDALSIHENVDEATIDALIGKGYPVFLWPLDDAQRIGWALGKQPYGIISDEPLLARGLRDQSAD